MLKTLDILIGVATVMLLFSMVVTIVTQAIISAFQTRGRNLRDGLAGLLKQLDPDIDEKIATNISSALLRHPLIGGKWGALGTVIHRDEFTTLLMEVAAGETTADISAAGKTAVVKLLQKNGISDPAGALKNIRDVALQLEETSPQLSNSVRHGLAILQEAKSEYVAKVHGWFDQTVDRVSQRFTASAHGITFVVALVVAFALQLDAIALINRLSTDEAMRAYLVDQAQGISKRAVETGAIPQKTDGSQNTGQAEITNTLQNNGLIIPPKMPFSYQSGRTPSFLWELKLNGNQLLGILLSSLLLSLGAPFWYGALQSLLKLRSAVAEKDDQQRAIRQGTDQDSAAAVQAG